MSKKDQGCGGCKDKDEKDYNDDGCHGHEEGNDQDKDVGGCSGGCPSQKPKPADTGSKKGG